MSSRKLLGEAVSDPYSLVGSAIATAFALAVAVYIAATIYGGHVNPAVTFGLAVGDHISIMMAIFYWISQILGSVMACLLLKVATVGEHVPILYYKWINSWICHGLSAFESCNSRRACSNTWNYSSTNDWIWSVPLRRGDDICIGLHSLCSCGFETWFNGKCFGIRPLHHFTGGSMNPEYSFGAALIGGSFKNQTVYWVGPLIGAAVAALIYDNMVFPSQAPDSLRGIADGV